MNLYNGSPISENASGREARGECNTCNACVPPQDASVGNTKEKPCEQQRGTEKSRRKRRREKNPERKRRREKSSQSADTLVPNIGESDPVSGNAQETQQETSLPACGRLTKTQQEQACQLVQEFVGAFQQRLQELLEPGPEPVDVQPLHAQLADAARTAKSESLPEPRKQAAKNGEKPEQAPGQQENPDEPAKKRRRRRSDRKSDAASASAQLNEEPGEVGGNYGDDEEAKAFYKEAAKRNALKEEQIPQSTRDNTAKSAPVSSSASASNNRICSTVKSSAVQPALEKRGRDAADGIHAALLHALITEIESHYGDKVRSIDEMSSGSVYRGENRPRRPDKTWLRIVLEEHDGMLQQSFHATNWLSTLSILREKAIKPGKRQDAAGKLGKTGPVAFASKNFTANANYQGPSSIKMGTEEAKICCVLMASAQEFQNSTNSKYNVAKAWRPMSILIRKWGTDGKDELTCTEVYQPIERFDWASKPPNMPDKQTTEHKKTCRTSKPNGKKMVIQGPGTHASCCNKGCHQHVEKLVEDKQQQSTVEKDPDEEMPQNLQHGFTLSRAQWQQGRDGADAAELEAESGQCSEKPVEDKQQQSRARMEQMPQKGKDVSPKTAAAAAAKSDATWPAASAAAWPAAAAAKSAKPPERLVSATAGVQSAAVRDSGRKPLTSWQQGKDGADAAELEAESGQCSQNLVSNPEPMLLPQTPFTDEFFRNLQRATEHSGSSDHEEELMQYILTDCMWGDLLYNDRDAETLMPFSRKMENLLEAVHKRRQLLLRDLLTDDSSHYIAYTDMKSMFNNWRKDVGEWMHEHNRKEYEYLKSGDKKSSTSRNTSTSKSAHDLGKKAFNKYLFQLCGDKFLLRKLIQLPLVHDPNSAAPPMTPQQFATSLASFIRDLHAHYDDKEYKEAAKKTPRCSQQFLQLTKQILRQLTRNRKTKKCYAAELDDLLSQRARLTRRAILTSRRAILTSRHDVQKGHPHNA